MPVVPSVIDSVTILGIVLVLRILLPSVIAMSRSWDYYFLLSLCNFLYITRLTSLSSSYSPNSMLGMVLVLVILIFIRSTSSSSFVFSYQGFASFHQLLFWPDYYLVGQFLRWSMCRCIKIWLDEQALMYLILLVSLSHHLGYDSVLFYYLLFSWVSFNT